jgi:LssY C-terminus
MSTASFRIHGTSAVNPRFGLAAFFAVALAVSGCATFQPRPTENADFIARAQTQSEGGVTISAAVLTAAESERVFGVPLEERGIQPVWLRIDNQSDQDYVFVPAGLDPNYYSPQEVAWASRSGFSKESRLAMETFFDQQRLRGYIPRHTTAEGYVHTTLDQGVKYVSVQLYYLGGRQQFDFGIEPPGFDADYRRVDFNAVVPPGSRRHVSSEELRELLRQLPCCVLGPDGTTPGDPLNVVLIGPPDKIFQPFVRRGWEATETISSSSVWRTISSSLFRSRYETSPISPLFLNGRPQDIGVQKARSSVDERNHMRLWLSPYRLDGMAVWVGQISRDIGVRLSGKTLVTHKIDPNVDEARDYLLQDLLLSGNLKAFGYVGGVGRAPVDAPRHNYTEDPYFTDGLRIVLILDAKDVPAARLQFLNWESPVEPASDGTKARQ